MAAVAVGLALLTGCGNQIDADGTADFLTEQVSSQTGFTPTDVECPSGLDAEVGTTFECTFTGPEGPYTASMKVLEVDGEEVLYEYQTQPVE